MTDARFDMHLCEEVMR